MELLYRQKFVLKIGDFGFSKQLSHLDEEMLTYCGTPLNMAPEIMSNRPYTYKADIWSIGVLIFLMLTGSYPFIANTKTQLVEKLDIGVYGISRQLKITSYCLDFINRALQFDRDKRMGWDEIISHPFFNHAKYYRYLEKLSFAVSYEDGNCHIFEIPKRSSKIKSEQKPQ